MSLDITMPQPCAASPEGLTARYSAIGTTMPPMAPSAGTSTVRGLRSSPVVSSRVTSSPSTRKNTAMAPSLITCRRSRCSTWLPIASEVGVSQNRK